MLYNVMVDFVANNSDHYCISVSLVECSLSWNDNNNNISQRKVTVSFKTIFVADFRNEP